jgi:hypothetical protein
VSPPPFSACIIKQMHRIETTIAGIGIPDSALAREATEFVREASTRLLFDHSRRVFLWASLQAERLSLDYDAELLSVAIGRAALAALPPTVAFAW